MIGYDNNPCDFEPGLGARLEGNGKAEKKEKRQ